MPPKVSILLPSLNAREFLESRIESLLQQTFPDWEAIVLDSQSTDGSWEFFQSVARTDSRFQLHQIPRDGLYAALNRGFQLAAGEFFHIATADDSMSPEFLAELLGAFSKCPDAGIAVSDVKFIDAGGHPLTERTLTTALSKRSARNLLTLDVVPTAFPDEPLRSLNYRPVPHDCLLHFNGRSVYFSLNQLLIRTSAARAVGPFKPNIGSVADFDWLLSLTSSTGTVHVPKKFAMWRFHGDQLSLQPDTSRATTRRAAAERTLGAVCDKHPGLLSENDRAALLLPVAISNSVFSQIARWFESFGRLGIMFVERSAPTLRALQRVKFCFGPRRHTLLPMIFAGLGIAPRPLQASDLPKGATHQRIPRWLLSDILVPFAASRVVLIVIAWLGFHLLHIQLHGDKWEVGNDGYGHFIAEHLSADAHPFVNMWARWDSGLYVDIAEHGYSFVPGQKSNVAFFPLYPALIRFFHFFFAFSHGDIEWLELGIILSNAALFVALVYFYRLVRLDYDRRIAARAVLYLCVFPTTLFLSAVYSESLFLVLILSGFYYARTNRWFLAGALSAAAAVCRPPGILMVLPLAFEYLAQREFQWRRIKLDCLALIFPVLALAGHLAFLRWRFGEWDVIAKAQKVQGWDRSPTFPWNTIVHCFRDFDSFNGFHGAFELFFTLALIGLVIFACFRVRKSYAIYSVVSLLFITSWGTLLSVPRFGLAIFPVIVALALLAENKLFNRACLAFCAVLAAVSMVVFSQWGWVA